MLTRLFTVPFSSRGSLSECCAPQQSCHLDFWLKMVSVEVSVSNRVLCRLFYCQTHLQTIEPQAAVFQPENIKLGVQSQLGKCPRAKHKVHHIVPDPDSQGMSQDAWPGPASNGSDPGGVF